jgi:hypothetical protein
MNMAEPKSETQVVVKKHDSAAKNIGVTITKHAHTLFGRTVRELGRIGIVRNASLDDATMMGFDLSNVPAKERVSAINLVRLLAERARRDVKRSDHQLTWFDTKQAAGLVWASQQGDDGAIALMAWADSRIDVVRTKEAETLKAQAKAKAAAKKAEAAKSGAADTASKSGGESSGQAGVSLIPGPDEAEVGPE